LLPEVLADFSSLRTDDGWPEYGEIFTMYRHNNCLLRDIVAKFWGILPAFAGKGRGHLGPM
jgi:hypothetical protein